ncbi:MAG: hypothetical protein ACREI7_06685 [Myxococcota bacterium]
MSEMRHDSSPGSPSGPPSGSPSDPPEPGHGEIQVSLHAKVLDIGLAVLAIETGTRLAPQHSLGMRMGSNGGELALSGYVVWCFFHGTAAAPSGEQQPVYRAGIEFSDVLTQRATDLLRFLEAHAVVTMETRLFGRFRLEEAGPVSLHSTAPFQVTALQGDALEIECDLGLEPAVGEAARVRLGTAEAVAATITELARPSQGDSWRLLLTFDEPQPDLHERAKALVL